MTFLGWRDRRTGLMYDMDKRVWDIDTDQGIVVLIHQSTGVRYAVRNFHEKMEVDGQEAYRFVKWYRAPSGPDQGMN